MVNYILKTILSSSGSVDRLEPIEDLSSEELEPADPVETDEEENEETQALDQESLYQNEIKSIRDASLPNSKKSYLARDAFPRSYFTKGNAILVGTSSRSPTEFDTSAWINDNLDTSAEALYRDLERFSKTAEFQAVAPASLGPLSHYKCFETAVGIAHSLNTGGKRMDILGEPHVVGQVDLKTISDDESFGTANHRNCLEELYESGVVGRAEHPYTNENYGLVSMHEDIFGDTLERAEKEGILLSEYRL